jgi:hypothetical protein
MEDPITGDDAVRSAVEEDEAEAVASGLGTAFLQPPDVKLRHDVAQPPMLVRWYLCTRLRHRKHTTVVNIQRCANAAVVSQ